MSLLRNQANPNISNKYGITPLMVCSWLNNELVSPLLLNKKANDKLKDIWGNTADDYFLMAGNEKFDNTKLLDLL